MSVVWHKLGELIERVERFNDDGRYGLDDVRGVSNTKLIQKTKANMEGRNFKPFIVLNPQEFVFNRRTTRNGERLGLGFNQDDRSYIFTEDYVAFRVKDESVLLPGYLYVKFLCDEFDRYVRWDSWGSATEFFNWENMQRVAIPVPAIDEQRKVVEAWQGLRKMKEDNERLAEPLMALCRSYMEEAKKKWPMVELGECVEHSDDRNDLKKYDAGSVKGISIEKKIIDTKADMTNVPLGGYKLFQPEEFCYVTVTSRNGEKVSLAENDTNDTFIVSGTYEVFRISDKRKLLPGFLKLWMSRSEFDRIARFNSWGSARETFNWNDMCRVKIPLPPMEVQKAVVDLYRCANEAKAIAAEADKARRAICPALIQKVVREVA